MSLVLKGGLILDPLSFKLEKKNIFITENRISFQQREDKGNNQEEIIDCSHSLITPGLVDAHTHLYQTFARGWMDDFLLKDWLSLLWDYETVLSREDCYYSTLLGSLEAIRTGTTSVSDMGGYFHTDAMVEAIRDSGLRARVGKFVSDLRESENTPCQGIEEAIEESGKFIRRWHNTAGGRIKASLAPRGLPACSKELMEAIARASRDLEVGIHTHAAEGKVQTEAIRKDYGMGEIEVLDRLGLLNENTQLAHTIWLATKEYDLLLESGAIPVHCPSSNLKLADGIAEIDRMIKMGIKVALGCDGAASSGSYSLSPEARLATLLQKIHLNDTQALPLTQLHRMLTINGAHALGLREDIGLVDEGRKADLVVWDLANIPYQDNRKIFSDFIYAPHNFKTKVVIIDGRIVFRKGRFLLLDEEEIISRSKRLITTLDKKLFAK